MPEQEDFYTPEQIDEQVDALLQERNILPCDLRMAHDLRAALTDEEAQADTQSLQYVLQQLLAGERSIHRQSDKRVPFSGLFQRQTRQGEPVLMQKIQGKSQKIRSVTRVFVTIAAVLVVAVLVGSMLLLIHSARQEPGGVSANVGTSTPTPPLTPTVAAKEGQIVYTSPDFDLAMPLIWSPDGSRVATAVNRTTVESWDARTGKNVMEYPVASGDSSILTPGVTTVNAVSNVAWSPDGSILAVCESQTIYLFDAKTAHLINSFSTSMLLAYNGTAASSPLATTSKTGQVEPLSSLAPLSGGSTFTNVVWSSDGKEVAAAFNGYTSSGTQHVIAVWNVSSGAIVKELNPGSQITSVKWSPKGNLFVALIYPPVSNPVSTDAIVWNTATWTKIKQYPGVYALDWSPDGTELALDDAGQIAGKDIRIIDALSGQTLRQFAQSEEEIEEMHWSPDGTRLALVSPKGITLWSAASGEQIYSFPSTTTVYEVTWSPDSKYVSCSQVSSDNSYVNILIWVA